MPSSQRVFWRSAVSSVAGEMLARCHDHRVVAAADADQRAAPAERLDAQPQFVVFGHASRVERLAAAEFSDAPQHVALNGAGYPGAGHRRTDGLAHHDVLGMMLGELVEIMPGDPARIGVD